jgi:hypothetical protein
MFTVLRLFGLCIGYIVLLMWLAGVFGLADFALSFKVHP